METDNPEKKYSKETSLEHRKKYAQFFTPPKIADLMAQWLIGNKSLEYVLEPAFGLGIFSRMLIKYNSNLKIKGFEIDSKIIEDARTIFSQNNSVSLLQEDYMYNDWENKYDGIICNPPYFKFHDYDNKGVLNEMEKRLSMRLNGFTNLYALFLLKSVNQLNDNGRAAYIIPSEFLNSDYGKLVKTYLIKNKLLRHIIVINFEENVFDDALTTASILLFANDKNDDAVTFSNVSTLDDLDKVNEIIKNYPYFTSQNSIDYNELNPDVKWRVYYQKQNSKKYKNIVPFSKYGKVMRGIATGANEYFTFSKSKIKKFNIPPDNLIPCITKSAQIENPFFTKEDFEKMIHADEDIFLLNVKNEQDANIKDYIKIGEDNKIHEKFLTSKRSPWYSLEKRPPAPIWVSVFNRNGLKFIRNEASISNLTTFHCIYPSKDSLFQSLAIDLLFAYLLTDTAKQIFEDNRREYGNGLKKFEPNDINKGMMLDLELLDKETGQKITDYYNLYRKSVIAGQEDTQLIKKIDDILIAKYT